MTQDYLKTDKGVQEFNDFIEHRSYVEGFSLTIFTHRFFPTQVDIAVLESIAKAPSSKTPHARRWYNHIFTFSDDEKKKFPGEKVAPKVFGPRIVIKGSENELGPFKPLDLDDEDILPNVTTDAVNLKENTCAKPKPKSQPESKPADDDDDVDLFGSDEEEDAEAAKIREERLKAYSDKKSKKAAIIAKSSILLDVKPWDDETDMAEMEHSVRTIEMEGLVWGASKLVPLAYGIKKLQILCVVEDEKVSVDDLVDKIQEFEDFVQSVDIAAFNKI